MKLRPVNALLGRRRMHSLIGAPPLFAGGGAAAVQLSHSLRFNDADSASLSRTFSAGTDDQWTIAAYVRRADLEVGGLFAAHSSAGNRTVIGFGVSTGDGEKLEWLEESASATVAERSCGVPLRDLHSFYLLEFIWDTNNATAADRMIVKVNGQRMTDFTGGSTDPSSGLASFYNTAIAHHIGQNGNAGEYFHGQLSDTYLVDGQALTGSEFAGVSSVTKTMRPKIFSGAFGTNGFRLNFSDATSTTTLGQDVSAGGSNDWTLTNFATTDQLQDNPSNVHPVLTPLEYDSSGTRTKGTYLEGNLQWQGPASVNGVAVLSMPFPAGGSWYLEVELNAAVATDVGVMLLDRSVPQDISTTIGDLTRCYTYRSNGNQELAGAESSYGATFTTGDVIGVHMNRVANELTFYKNGTTQGVAWSALDATHDFVLVIGEDSSNVDVTIDCGQRGFAHSLPSGASRLSTQNLDDPTVLEGSEHVAGYIWTGNDTNPRSFTDTALIQFTPNVIITSARTSAKERSLWQSNSGTRRQLRTANTDAMELNPPDGSVSAFDANGFSVDDATTDDNVNDSTVGGYSAQLWQSVAGRQTWRAYTGLGISPQTQTHALGVAPVAVIARAADTLNGGSWYLGHHQMRDTSPWLWAKVLETAAAPSSSTNHWNGTAPDSTNVTLGANLTTSGVLFGLFSFAQVDGYSAFPYFVGNANADGPFVFCGFAPQMVMIARADTSGSLVIFDRARNGANPRTKMVKWDVDTAESTVTDAIDFCANGFKIRTTDTNINASGGRYVVLAWAAHPFKHALADSLIPD